MIKPPVPTNGEERSLSSAGGPLIKLPVPTSGEEQSLSSAAHDCHASQSDYEGTKSGSNPAASRVPFGMLFAHLPVSSSEQAAKVRKIPGQLGDLTLRLNAVTHQSLGGLDFSAECCYSPKSWGTRLFG